MPAKEEQKRRPKGQKAGAEKPEGIDAKEGGILGVDEAAEFLDVARSTFYRWLRAGMIKGMKVGRQWRFYREDLERFLKGQGPKVDLPADIGPLIVGLKKRLDELGAAAAEPQEDEDKLGRAVDLLLHVAIAQEASDVHVDAQEDCGRVRTRLDGVLHELATYDARLHGPVVDRLKTMASLDVHEKRRTQDGRMVVRAPDEAHPVDVRINVLPAHFGEAVTMRLLRRAEVRLAFDRLDFAPRDEKLIKKWIEAPWGVVIVTGPTGCGKTTTLYTCLEHLVRPEAKIVTIEDPVEFAINGLVQVQVNEQVGNSFATLIRAELRADPDIMMVGEIRNLEVAQMVQQVALTGHLVMTTLHTDEAAAALVRLVDIGVDPFLVADAERLVVAQRLVRRLCPECSEPAEPDADRLRQATELAHAGGLDVAGPGPRWRRAVGCPTCKQTGYRGRVLVGEALEVTPEVGAALRRGAATDELRTIAVGQGMKTMAAHGVQRAAAGGETTVEEVLRVVPQG